MGRYRRISHRFALSIQTLYHPSNRLHLRPRTKDDEEDWEGAKRIPGFTLGDSLIRISPEGATGYGENRLRTFERDRVHISKRVRTKRLFRLTQGKPWYVISAALVPPEPSSSSSFASSTSVDAGIAPTANDVERSRTRTTTRTTGATHIQTLG